MLLRVLCVPSSIFTDTVRERSEHSIFADSRVHQQSRFGLFLGMISGSLQVPMDLRWYLASNDSPFVAIAQPTCEIQQVDGTRKLAEKRFVEHHADLSTRSYAEISTRAILHFKYLMTLGIHLVSQGRLTDPWRLA